MLFLTPTVNRQVKIIIALVAKIFWSLRRLWVVVLLAGTPSGKKIKGAFGPSHAMANGSSSTPES
jgi:hypothetical protein